MNAAALLKEGRVALAEARWKEAHRLLTEAAGLDPTPEVYEELAWACWWIIDNDAVFEYRAKAYQGYLDRKDPYGASRNACWAGLDSIEIRGEMAVANGWFQRAENVLEGTSPSPEWAIIRALRARWTFEVEKNREKAFELADEAIRISKSISFREGLMIALAIKGHLKVMLGEVVAGMKLLDESTLMAVLSENTDVKTSTVACCYLIDACERVRDYPRAAEWCNRVRQMCKRWGFDTMFANCTMKYAGVLINEGKWKEAGLLMESALEQIRLHRPKQEPACIVRLADLNRRLGNWELAADLLSKAGHHPLKNLYEAELNYDRAEYKAAAEGVERYLRPIDPAELAGRTAGVELALRTAVRLGQWSRAQAWLEELRRIAAALKTTPIQASACAAEGMLLGYQGKTTEGRQKLEEAIDGFDQIHLPYEAARNRVWLAEILLQVDETAQAESELECAAESFQQLGAMRDEEKARHLLKQIVDEKSRNQKSYRYDFAFSGRELEVLRLVAEGKSNEVVAEKLFLSVRTVEKHLGNIYSKIGVSGKSARAYAASYAIRHQLVST